MSSEKRDIKGGQPRAVFDRFKVVSADQNSEFIPPSLVFRALQEMNLNPSSMEVAKRLGQADENKAGMLSFQEFLSLYAQFSHSEHRVQKAIDDFMILDTNHDGVLDREELYEKLSVIAPGERLSDSEFDAFFREIDVDQDNEISVVEFAMQMCPDVSMEELTALIRGYKGLEKSAALKGIVEDKDFEENVRKTADARSASPTRSSPVWASSPLRNPTQREPAPSTDDEKQNQQVEEARRKLESDIQNLRTASPELSAKAPSPKEGKAPSPKEGKAPAMSPKEGKAPSPKEGKAPAMSPKEAKAMSPKEAKTMSPKEAKAMSPKEAKAVPAKPLDKPAKVRSGCC